VSRIDDLLADEGATAERNPTPERLPEHVSLDRPNLGKPTVVSVRLSAEEHGQTAGRRREGRPPVSTLMRIWAMDRLRAEREGADGSVAERLARLERAVFRRSA
jgi:hypothetical protein